MREITGRPFNRLHHRAARGSAARISLVLREAARGRSVMVLCGLTLYLGVSACSERTGTMRVGGSNWFRSGQPDQVPLMTNPELPFRYPVSLFQRRLQGNVLLRLYVDSNGTVIPDSTRVAEPSGEPLFDSAAVAGSTQLRFQPARRRGVPIAVVLLYPVHFRHPEGRKLPGDSL
jgi:TonB family protein